MEDLACRDERNMFYSQTWIGTLRLSWSQRCIKSLEHMGIGRETDNYMH
jgi:hypothetical protein